jgi:hypothetical protein
MQKEWTGKKSPTNPNKKEQHQNRKTKEELVHRWQNDDWKNQYKDYINNASKPL